MVRHHMLKIGTLACALLVCSGSAHAAETASHNFNVNIKDTLTVSFSTPDNWASGQLSYNSTSGKWSSDLLRNIIGIDVSSNSSAGFTITMTSASTTSAALQNLLSDSTSDTIPTLTSDWTRANTTNTLFWGYSMDDASETGTYHQIALKNATPNTLYTTTTNSSVSKDVYFGAKADSTVASGTYSGTVIISVVTGTNTNNQNDDNGDNGNQNNDPTPQNPTNNDPVSPVAVPSSMSGNSGLANSSPDQPASPVKKGATATAFYADPAGVTTTVGEGTPLATGLAVTSAISATAGIFFLIAAKRRKDEDEEETQNFLN